MPDSTGYLFFELVISGNLCLAFQHEKVAIYVFFLRLVSLLKKMSCYFVNYVLKSNVMGFFVLKSKNMYLFGPKSDGLCQLCTKK